MELIRNFRDGICSDGSMCSYIMNTFIIVGFGSVIAHSVLALT